MCEIVACILQGMLQNIMTSFFLPLHKNYLQHTVHQKYRLHNEFILTLVARSLIVIEGFAESLQRYLKCVKQKTKVTSLYGSQSLHRWGYCYVI